LGLGAQAAEEDLNLALLGGTEMKGKYCTILVALQVAFLVIGFKVRAEVEIGEPGKVFDKFLVGGEINLYAGFYSKPYYGAPIPGTHDNNTRFCESYSRITFWALKILPWARLTAGSAFIWEATLDQDLYGLYKDRSEVDVDWAYLKLEYLFNSPFDLTVGRQYINIEKSMIIGSGYFQKTAAWLLFQRTWPFAVRLDGSFGPFEATAIWAESKNYWQEPGLGDPTKIIGRDGVDVAGINLHYTITETAYVFGGFYKKLDDSGVLKPNFAGTGRDLHVDSDTEAYDIGTDLRFGPFNLEGEFVYQSGKAGRLGDTELNRDAFGLVTSARYTLNLPYSPYLRLHYIYLSGDDNPNDSHVNDYDPMFYPYIAYNRFFVGALVGPAQLPFTNKKVGIVEVGFAPTKWSNIYLIWLNHRLSERFYLGIPVTHKEWANELNLICDLSVTDHLFIYVGLGYIIPSDAAKEIFRSDDNAFLAQTWFRFYF
jgi:hypothetical protein